MSLREAAQQALEALEAMAEGAEDECGEPTCRDCKAWRPVWAAMASLRAALEQPEQEPVAWMVYTQDGKSVCVTDNPADFIEWRSFPLFTHPPRREWRGLTEEEAAACWFVSSVKTWQAIEAALKERNV
jgi:hypothetical protein